MKKAAGTSVVVLVLLITGLFALPAFVDLGMFKRTYLPWVENSLQRRVDVGEVRLSLVPAPSIRLSNLRVADNPAFRGNTFFDARKVELRLKLWPLLRGRFEVSEFVLDEPVMNLVKLPDGTFNYSDLAAPKSAAVKRSESKRHNANLRPQETAAIPLIVPRRMRIKDGTLNLETRGQKPLRISGIDLSLEEFSSEQPFAYRASFDFPGLKTVSLEGRLEYKEQEMLKLNETRLKIRDLALPVQGSVSGLATVPRVNLVLASDRLEALPVFQILSVFGLAPRDTEVSGPMGLRMTVTGPSHSLVTQVHGRFRDVKVHGKRALKGFLNGSVSIRLPLGGTSSVIRRLQGEGRLTARDGELTNVDLINKIQRVTGLMGFSQDERREVTTFKTLQAEFVIGNGLTDLKNLYLVNPQMEVTGGGTMTLDQPNLNLAIEAKLSAQASARAGRGHATTFFKDGEGRVVVPLKITGPVERPSVNLDSAKMAQRGASRSLEKGLDSFFKQLFRR